MRPDLPAADATDETEYLHRARLTYEWFFGRNLRGESLYDPETGGCFDALIANDVNRNRGAESTICLLHAHLSIYEARQRIPFALLSHRDTEEAGRISASRPASALPGVGRQYRVHAR